MTELREIYFNLLNQSLVKIVPEKKFNKNSIILINFSIPHNIYEPLRCVSKSKIIFPMYSGFEF